MTQISPEIINIIIAENGTASVSDIAKRRTNPCGSLASEVLV